MKVCTFETVVEALILKNKLISPFPVCKILRVSAFSNQPCELYSVNREMADF